MDFDTAVKTLNRQIRKKKPKAFSSTWIFANAQSVYHYFRENHRTENGGIDWDIATVALPRKYQKRWMRYRYRQVASYENQDEVNRVLDRYRDKLYTFIAPLNEDDRRARNKIVIALVRIAQKGNLLAQQEIVTWMMFVVTDWIEKHWQICKWKGYTDEIEEKIVGCIRRYRYTGSFLGYLFKTLEYSARGIVPLQKFSFDDPVGDGSTTRIDYFVQESEEVREIENVTA